MDEHHGPRRSQLNLNLFLRVGIVAIRIPGCCSCHASVRTTGSLSNSWHVQQGQDTTQFHGFEKHITNQPPLCNHGPSGRHDLPCLMYSFIILYFGYQRIMYSFGVITNFWVIDRFLLSLWLHHQFPRLDSSFAA